ncbi:MAG: hypothetical protein ACREAA_11875 [Candidatus Polarisedimenticolia bacterium]
MRPVFTNGLKFIGMLGLAVAIQSWAPQLVAAAPGRDYSRCVHTCNDARRACGERCAGDCQALFPNSPSQREECIVQCKALCNGESEDCKAVCRAIKDGGCPGEP